MRNVRAALRLGLGLWIAAPAHAQDAPPFSPTTSASPGADAAAKDPSASIVTDRPDFTESPLVVPMRFKAQIEGGYTFTRSGEDREHAIGEILVRVPVAERVELRFGLPSYLLLRSDANGDASGFDDAFLGAKFALSGGSGETGFFKRPATALLIGTSLPTGASAFREDDLQPEAILALAIDLTDNLKLGSNLGYARASDGGERFNQFFGSVSLGVELTERAAAYFEFYGFTRVDAATTDGERFFNGGLTYLINDDFQLDARAGVGLNNDAAGPDYFFGFGFARRF